MVSVPARPREFRTRGLFWAVICRILILDEAFATRPRHRETKARPPPKAAPGTVNAATDAAKATPKGVADTANAANGASKAAAPAKAEPPSPAAPKAAAPAKATADAKVAKATNGTEAATPAGATNVTEAAKPAGGGSAAQQDNSKDFVLKTAPKIGIVGLVKMIVPFYLAEYFIVFTLYLILRRFSENSTQVELVMKAIARTFNTYPRLAPAIVGFVFFTLTDIMAQSTPSYWDGNTRAWDPKTTLVVAGVATVSHSVVLNRLYKRADQQMGDFADWRHLIKRTGHVVGWFVCAYLPVAILAMNIVCCMLCRFLFQITDNCGVSAAISIPGDFLSGIEYGVLSSINSYKASVLFWPPNFVLSFAAVSRWAPEFRTTVDVVTLLLWNIYATSKRSHDTSANATNETVDEPIAIGPAIVGRGPVGEVAAPPAYVDCSKWAFLPIAEALGNATMKIVEGGVCYGAYGLVKSLGLTWNGTKWVVAASENVTEEGIEETETHATQIQVYGCRGLLFSYTIARVFLYAAGWTIWNVIAYPFWFFDQVKWWCLMPFVPKMFPYQDTPYSYLWPWNQNDTWSYPWVGYCPDPDGDARAADIKADEQTRELLHEAEENEHKLEQVLEKTEHVTNLTELGITTKNGTIHVKTTAKPRSWNPL